MSEEKRDQAPRLVVRLDDLGFCHAANEACRRILCEGVCTSLSTIVTTPWLDEAVDIAKAHPGASYGVHLTLNSEWREYRWGPVSAPADVPSLVDASGRFFGTRRELMAKGPRTAEVARELRAQIERAMAMGLPVSYCDNHMGTAISTLEFQEAMEQIAADYRIGISRYFGEVDAPGVYTIPPERKASAAVRTLEQLVPGMLYLMVFHPGTDTPELAAMTDLNETGLAGMSLHRQAETDLLCGADFSQAIARRGIDLVGYAELNSSGPGGVQRPFESPKYADVVAEARRGGQRS